MKSGGRSVAGVGFFFFFWLRSGEEEKKDHGASEKANEMRHVVATERWRVPLERVDWRCAHEATTIGNVGEGGFVVGGGAGRGGARTYRGRVPRSL